MEQIHERAFLDRPDLEAQLYVAFLEMKQPWVFRMFSRLMCKFTGHCWYRFYNFRQCLMCYAKRMEKP